ncbi:hypothetical protein [Kordia jejudonensis]|uniref:hypothetical protein n=1 Tax=Kordia jejudonensis TaxID=1348245 RepID=UPI000629AAF2|nr:hypothetical protein [Kordia jejudonensis]
MKKKNLKLGKLSFKKSNVASLIQRDLIMGGSGVGPGCNSDIECTQTCPQDTCTSAPQPDPDPQSNLPCHTQGFTCGPVCNITEDCGSSPGAFLCVNETFNRL